MTPPTGEEPLRVRCARALGWKKPSEEGRCDVCGWPVTVGGDGCWATNCAMRPAPERRHDAPPPYGDNTPEGWACTGPLIERFMLAVYYTDYNNEGWVACVFGGPPGSGVIEHNACAAVAEWVAHHAAQAQKETRSASSAGESRPR